MIQQSDVKTDKITVEKTQWILTDILRQKLVTTFQTKFSFN
jgi:hypothetical protein